jgi:hypothetical protein
MFFPVRTERTADDHIHILVLRINRESTRPRQAEPTSEKVHQCGRRQQYGPLAALIRGRDFDDLSMRITPRA